MLEKFLNKEVKILILPVGRGMLEVEEGIITSADDKFIEINNEKLINILHVYQIKLK